MLTVFTTAWFVIGEPSAVELQARITTTSSSTTTRPAPKPPAPTTDGQKPGASAQISDAAAPDAPKTSA